MAMVSSVMLTATLGSTLTALVAGHSNYDNIDSKLSELKKDLFQEMDAREKQAEQKITEKIDEKFDALLRFLRGGQLFL
jgi:hypothetical protein